MTSYSRVVGILSSQLQESLGHLSLPGQSANPISKGLSRQWVGKALLAVRMNMYIAQAKNGNFQVVKNLGVIEREECMQGIK